MAKIGDINIILPDLETGNDVSDGNLKIFYTGTANRVLLDAYDEELKEQQSSVLSINLSGLTLNFENQLDSYTGSRIKVKLRKIYIYETINDKVVAQLKSITDLDTNDTSDGKLKLEINSTNFYLFTDTFNDTCSGNFRMEVIYDLEVGQDSYHNITVADQKSYEYYLCNEDANRLVFNVKYPDLVGIEIDGNARKRKFYSGEAFQYSGLSVVAKYVSTANWDQYTKNIDNYTISKQKGDILSYDEGSTQLITISYRNYSVQYSIEIVDVDLSNCSFVGVYDKFTVVGNGLDDIVKPSAISVAYTDGRANVNTTNIVWEGTFNSTGTSEVRATFTTTEGLVGTLSYYVNVYESLQQVIEIKIMNALGSTFSSFYSTYKSTFNLNDYWMKITYNESEVAWGQINGNTITGSNMSFVLMADNGMELPINSIISRGCNFVVKVRYNGIESISDSLTLNVSDIPLGISVIPESITNVRKNQNFSKSNLVVKYLTSSNGTGQVVNSTDYTTSLGEGQQYGETTQIQVSYTNTFGEVYQSYVNVSTLEKTLNDIEITSQPTKLSYIEGDILDTSGLVVVAHYNNGYADETITPESVSLGSTGGKGNGSTLEIGDNGKKLVVVYQTKQKQTNDISVIAQVMTSLSITGVQSTGYVGDNLDKTNIVATATLNNGYVFDVKSSLVYSIEDPFDEVGTKTITISYTYGSVTLSKTFDISVSLATLTDLVVSPTNIGLTTGNVFNINSITVKPKYANGYIGSAITTFTYDDTGFANTEHIVGNNYGSAFLKITYLDIEKSIPVTVNKNSQVKSIRIDYVSNTKKYFVGDVYDASDINVEVQYVGDEKWYVYQGFTTSPAVGSTFRRTGSQKIIVSAGEVNAQYNVVITAPSGQDYVDEKEYGIGLNVNETLKIDGIDIQFGELDDGDYRYPLYPVSSLDSNNHVVDKLSCIGYIEFGIENVKNAHVVLFEDPKNPIEGDGNIVVTFPHYVSGYADKINKATFGTIFNGRLFVSGNPEMPNYDWRTSAINSAQIDNYDGIASGDFTYFVDLHENAYGSDHTAVLGYDTYSDGTLIVVKEDSKYEATLYTRQVSNTTATNSSGDSIENTVEDNYPCFDINTNGGIGGISKNGIANYLGDTLLITKQGLKRLISKNTYNNEKITIDVSSFINSKITQEELQEASLYTFEDKLLLKTNRGVYVAFNNLREDNEYEWYFLNNIDSKLFFEIEDQLYFADSEGRINRFSNGIFKDIERVFIASGGLYNDGYLNISSALYNDYIKVGNSLHLTHGNKNIYSKLGNFVSYNRLMNNSSINYDNYDGVIKQNSEGWVIELKNIDERFYDGREIYIDSVNGSGILNNSKFTLERYYDLEPFTYKFFIVKDNGDKVNLSAIYNFRIKIVINNISRCYISEIRAYNEGKEFKIKDNYGEVLDIISDSSLSWSGVITTKEDNVVSFYITRPFDMDSLLYGKTIYLWSIANDTDLASYMDVGYYINGKAGDYTAVIKTASGSRALDFNYLSFDKVQFTSDKLPHIYTRQRLLQNVGFIRYIFQNDSDTNMVLSQMQLLYTYGQVMKGIK